MPGYPIPYGGTDRTAGATPVTGSGTVNTLAKFTGASAVGNSQVTDDGTTVTSPNLAVSGSTASRIALFDASKKLVPNGAVTTNALPKSVSSGASLADSAVSDDATKVTISSNLIISGLTASRLVVSDSSKQLASNGSITTNAIPKSASSGASLSASSASDDGTTFAITEQVQLGRVTATGFTPSATNSNASGAIQTGSTDFSGTVVLTGDGASSSGIITLTFSAAATTGWRVVAMLENTAGGTAGSWSAGGEVWGASRSTTAVTLNWNNATAAGVGTALVNTKLYNVNYVAVAF